MTATYRHDVHFQNVEQAINRLAEFERMQFGSTVKVTVQIPFEYDQFIRAVEVDRSDGRVSAVLEEMIKHRVLEMASELKGNRDHELYKQYLQEPPGEHET